MVGTTQVPSPRKKDACLPAPGAGTRPEEPAVEMDLEQVQFVDTNFDIRRNEAGTTIVVDKIPLLILKHISKVY